MAKRSLLSRCPSYFDDPSYSSDVFIFYFPNAVFNIFTICPHVCCITFFPILLDLAVPIVGLEYKL